MPLSRKFASPHMHTHSSGLAVPSARTRPGTAVPGSYFSLSARCSEPPLPLPRPFCFEFLPSSPKTARSTSWAPCAVPFFCASACVFIQTCVTRCKERGLNPNSGRQTCRKQNTRDPKTLLVLVLVSVPGLVRVPVLELELVLLTPAWCCSSCWSKSVWYASVRVCLTRRRAADEGSKGPEQGSGFREARPTF